MSEADVDQSPRESLSEAVSTTSSTSTTQTSERTEEVAAEPKLESNVNEVSGDSDWDEHVLKYRKILENAVAADVVEEWEASLARLNRVMQNTTAPQKKSQEERDFHSRQKSEKGNGKDIDFRRLSFRKIAEDYDCMLVVRRPRSYVKTHTDSTDMLYLVSKSVLTAASTVFTSDLKASAPRDPFPDDDLQECPLDNKRVKWSLELEFNPKIVRKIMEFIHFIVVDDLDYQVDWETLVGIAAFCKEYKLQRALLPWRRLWLDLYSSETLSPGYEDWLHISEALNSSWRVDELTDLLSDICQHHEPQENYILVDYRETETSDTDASCGYRKVSTALWSQGALGLILVSMHRKLQYLSARLKAIEAVLRPSPDSEARVLCSSKQCISLAYGSFLGSIHGKGLSKILNGGEWKGSAATLRRKLESITFESLQSLNIHHRCRVEGVANELRAYINREIPFDDDKDGISKIEEREQESFEEIVEALDLQEKMRNSTLAVQSTPPVTNADDRLFRVAKKIPRLGSNQKRHGLPYR